jgi:hypothetical protein
VSLAKTFELEGFQETATMVRDLVQDKFDRPGAPFEEWTKKPTAPVAPEPAELTATE